MGDKEAWQAYGRSRTAISSADLGAGQIAASFARNVSDISHLAISSSADGA
jgi:hypothetical protein